MRTFCKLLIEKKMKDKNLILAFVALFIFVLTSCRNEELGESIFDTNIPIVDKTAYTYKLDQFLLENFRLPYNLDFKYMMEDVGTNMNYNLTPATYENAKIMAVLVKYLWYDVYRDVVDSSFLKNYGPRIIHLIGSGAYNPANATEIFGLAEGGIKVSLYKVNEMNVNDMAGMNERYFKTMHHEFAHLLHQAKLYPREFDGISFQHYDPISWQDRPFEVAASLGFASNYGSSETREDFVEIIANYIVKTDDDWDKLLDVASKHWVAEGSTAMQTDTDNDKVDGRAVIIQKLDLCRVWLSDRWGVDLDELRAEVQLRQKNINNDFVNELLQHIENIE
jgi:substrate import-associated zinc metallohydrolase lipoprotein